MPRKAKLQSEGEPQSQPQTMTLAELRASLLAEVLAEVDKRLAPVKKSISELRDSKRSPETHSHQEYAKSSEVDELWVWAEEIQKLPSVRADLLAKSYPDGE